MANVNPTVPATFDSVYQLETTDPVEAGLGGVDNLQALALVNRTQYLKDLVDKILPYTPVFRGYITGLDAGGGTIGNPVSKSAGITTAVIHDVQAGSTISSTVYRITLAQSIGTTNFYVRISLQSMGTILSDNNCTFVYAIQSATVIDFAIQDFPIQVQNLRLHFEIVKY